MRQYNDRVKRVGSEDHLTLPDYIAIGIVTLFVLMLVGSLIWGNEGFVELLGSFF